MSTTRSMSCNSDLLIKKYHRHAQMDNAPGQKNLDTGNLTMTHCVIIVRGSRDWYSFFSGVLWNTPMGRLKKLELSVNIC